MKVVSPEDVPCAVCRVEIGERCRKITGRPWLTYSTREPIYHDVRKRDAMQLTYNSRRAGLLF